MLITLTTDFGYQDPFVGIMKGVILGVHPEARIVDLCHEIAPHDVMAGALVLRHAVPYFPRGAIHVAVVDPGVGSTRRPIVIESDGHYYIGPDNGVLSLALGKKGPSCIIHLSNPSYHLTPTSNTFHGRDIFAPVAAHLSLGTPPSAFGEQVATFQRLSWPPVINHGRTLVGEVVYVDRFGNLTTNIAELDLSGLAHAQLTFRLGELKISGLVPNYAAADKGGFLAVINSWGLVEIALHKDSAQKRSGAKIGDKVEVS